MGKEGGRRLAQRRGMAAGRLSQLCCPPHTHRYARAAEVLDRECGE